MSQELQDYINSAQFQTDVYEAICAKLESGESLGIGKRLSPDSAAQLAGVSPNKGWAFPAMSEAQRDLIVDPFGGLVIYNSTTAKLNLFTTTWEEITSV